jgi:hypothetical protein
VKVLVPDVTFSAADPDDTVKLGASSDNVPQPPPLS